ncbi:biotin/lipoyl-containing protein [Thalassoroseus pseudoceratinae]|uniref:biotin/lipoyl-containing protein n=1 Tax=Thalassoroseus pseudoceratinae TaxID=2713176 RepID=UPI001423D060|nr:lipoyl domain-containing protein [Thalassoroseus pseudoceratinae]
MNPAGKSPIPVCVPDLGQDDRPANVCNWLVEPGDAVEEGDRLAEVVLPGIVFYVSASASGTFLQQERSQGASVFRGDCLGFISPGTGPELS